MSRKLDENMPHLEGSWAVDTGVRGRACYVVDSEGRDVAVVPYREGDAQTETMAQAISATPDLIKACRAAYWAIRHYAGDSEDGEVRQLLHAALMKARVEP